MSITREVVLKTAALAHLEFPLEDVDHFYLRGAPKILGFHSRGAAS